MKHLAWLLLFCFPFTLTSFAAPNDDDKTHHHHEDLTEAQLGTVHFPTTCAASVQKSFERGVALLHSFWYEEAEKEFEDIAVKDPHCAMAHWGIAMSIWHQLWNEPDEKVIARGVEECRKATGLDFAVKLQESREHTIVPGYPTDMLDHELAYITALGRFYNNSDKLDHDTRARSYSDAMQKVYEAYPNDNEAAIFYALSLLASDPHEDATFARRKQAAAILEKLFAIEPDHPGVAHYLIHSYDKPQLAELGIPAARRYAEVAPAAPHALHMPSHIFARVGLWQDDIKSNLASVAATRKTAAMGMGGEGHQFHAMDFLFYAYLQSGREADARALIEEIKNMPAMHDMYGLGFDPHESALAHLTALYPIEMHDWTTAAALTPTAVPGTAEESTGYWAKAIGSAHLGKPDDVKKDVAEIERIRQTLVDSKKKDFADAAENDLKQAQAWLLFAEDRYDDAVEALRPLADKEDSLGDEPQGVPTREMMADMLLEANRPQQALAEYRTDLKLNPNRFDGLSGAARAAELAGKSADASEYYALLLKVCEGSNSTRPELSRARQLVAQK